MVWNVLSRLTSKFKFDRTAIKSNYSFNLLLPKETTIESSLWKLFAFPLHSTISTSRSHWFVIEMHWHIRSFFFTSIINYLGIVKQHNFQKKIRISIQLQNCLFTDISFVFFVFHLVRENMFVAIELIWWKHSLVDEIESKIIDPHLLWRD